MGTALIDIIPERYDFEENPYLSPQPERYMAIEENHDYNC